MESNKARAKRQGAGLYIVEAGGERFQIRSMERHSEGARRGGWLLFREDENSPYGAEWLQTFATKRDALEAIAAIIDEKA